MSEILDFPERDPKHTLTALGRFLLAADQQKEEQQRQALLRTERPSSKAITAAKKELQHLFSGDNKKETERLCQEGLYDIVHQRKESERREALLFFPDGATGVMTIEVSTGYTPAALFYIHIETLLELAHRAHDKISKESN